MFNDGKQKLIAVVFSLFIKHVAFAKLTSENKSLDSSDQVFCHKNNIFQFKNLLIKEYVKSDKLECYVRL